VRSGERERVYLPQKIKNKHTKNILNISTVAGYQKGKPIKLVAYSTNYTGWAKKTGPYLKVYDYCI